MSLRSQRALGALLAALLAGAAGCGPLGSTGGRHGTNGAAVDPTTLPCGQGVLVGGTVPFDLSGQANALYSPTWTADRGTVAPATGWDVTFTAPATAGVAHVTVTFVQDPGPSKSQTWTISVLATAADLSAFETRCTAPAPLPNPDLSPIASHTDPATGLTVTLLASTTHVPHDGYLVANLKATNDGTGDVTVLACYTLSQQLFLETPGGQRLSVVTGCYGPTMVCDDNLVQVLHPGDTARIDMPQAIHFGATTDGCLQDTPFAGYHYGVETAAGDGTYTLVAQEGLPPVAAGQGVQASATITVGP